MTYCRMESTDAKAGITGPETGVAVAPPAKRVVGDGTAEGGCGVPRGGGGSWSGTQPVVN